MDGPQRTGALARIAVCCSEERLRAQIELTVRSAERLLIDAFESARVLLASASMTGPEVVVLGASAHTRSTAIEASRLRHGLKNVPLILVSASVGASLARQLMQGELHGLVHEREIRQALVPTIDAVLSNQLCIPRDMRQPLAQPVLTWREKQVLGLVLAGLTTRAIAKRLYLAETTVKTHVTSSFRKLGVSSRAEATRKLLDPEAGFALNTGRAGGQPAPTKPFNSHRDRRA
jgi:DNA-binding NarL/FixJ family response regulator